MADDERTPTRCVGLMGWIFGHKFTQSVGEWIYRTNNCRRCGIARPRFWR